MAVPIRRFDISDIDAVVRLSLLAWEPVFVAWERILGPELYPIAIYRDWRASQQEAVERICHDEEIMTWVSEVDGQVAGFVSYSLNDESKTGEVELIAVSPDYQNRGVGTALNDFALEKMKEAGMNLAVAATGGDEGHAPARRSYEKAGYTALPLARYYKAL
ncbi:GNAT family N-acetyltransferase [Candidatus Poribacteria bacterium]|nr:GNAT family N-acetyltransferase [Candidatus Poribacteria bacterium]